MLAQNEKYFKIAINGKPCNITIDRLKPTYTLEEQGQPGDTPDHTKTLAAPDKKPRGRPRKLTFQAA